MKQFTRQNRQNQKPSLKDGVCPKCSGRGIYVEKPTDEQIAAADRPLVIVNESWGSFVRFGCLPCLDGTNATPEARKRCLCRGTLISFKECNCPQSSIARAERKNRESKVDFSSCGFCGGIGMSAVLAPSRKELRRPGARIFTFDLADGSTEFRYGCQCLDSEKHGSDPRCFCGGSGIFVLTCQSCQRKIEEQRIVRVSGVVLKKKELVVKAAELAQALAAPAPTRITHLNDVVEAFKTQLAANLARQEKADMAPVAAAAVPVLEEVPVGTGT